LTGKISRTASVRASSFLDIPQTSRRLSSL
jgi:hypothetical protein